MARISTYQLDNDLTKDDKVLGSDSGGATRNFSLEDIAKFTSVAIKSSGSNFYNITADHVSSSNNTFGVGLSHNLNYNLAPYQGAQDKDFNVSSVFPVIVIADAKWMRPPFSRSNLLVRKV